ncbi:MAG: hypothetical protein LUE27_10625 [Clostridia bacterium]|nr:hypothetical protein [Clostridia bacterium]
MSKVADAIKAIIDREGLGYLDTDAYSVYTELLENKAADGKTARMILIALLAGAHRQKKRDASSLSSFIQQECGLSASNADDISGILAELLSADNRKEWKDNAEKGFREFCDNEWSYELYSSAEWNSRGRHMDCSCTVNMDIAVDEADALHKALEKLLSKNPFTTADEIYRFIKSKLQKKLDDDFEEYCDVDDYYPPYVEEEYGDICNDAINDFCADYGLKLLSFDYEGDEDY